MILDFFVHPHKPRHDKMYCAEELAKYEIALYQKIKQSEQPVLIRGLKEEGIFEKEIPQSFQFQSHIQYHGPLEQKLCGEISNEDLKRFILFINPLRKNNFRIHGAYLEQVQAFAIQLFGYLTYGQNLRTFALDYTLVNTSKKETINEAEKTGAFRASPVRLGYVMIFNGHTFIQEPSRHLKFLGGKFKYGNITSQLIDLETRLYDRHVKLPVDAEHRGI